MAKKYYKKPTKNKKKQIPVCGDCLLDPTDSDLKETDFYWILKHDPEFPSMDHYFLSCVNCIEKHNYIAAKPYKKKSGRPKKTDKK